MVTLAAAVDADDTTWQLSEALPAGTEYILAESELVAVVTPAIRESQRQDPTLYCEVVRGWEGTRASHAQGITLTPSENPPLGSGSEQTVRLLHWDFDFADVEAYTYMPDFELLAGQILRRTWVVLLTGWVTDDDDAELRLLLNDTPATLEVQLGSFQPAKSVNSTAILADNEFGYEPVRTPVIVGVDPNPKLEVIVESSAGWVIAVARVGGDAFTAGTARLYVEQALNPDQ